MDFTTVKRNLAKNEYSTVEACLHDMRLVWDNCTSFNEPNSEIYRAASRLSSKMEEQVEVGPTINRVSLKLLRVE